MNRKRMLLVAAILGLLAATLTYTYIRSIQVTGIPEVKEVSVIVATSDIPPGATISPNMLRLIQTPEASLHPEAATKANEVMGRIAKAPIVQGEQILLSRLLPAGVTPSLTFAIPDGKRAISVAVNEVVGVAGFVKPGDRVDVLATVDDPYREETITTTVLQDVEVLAIAQDMEEEVDKKPKVSTTVTLAVDLLEAQKVTLAEETGTLRLALRPIATRNREWVNPTIGSDLGTAASPQVAHEPKPQAPTKVPSAPKAAHEVPTPSPIPKPAPEFTVEIIRGTDRELVSVKAN
ncbi:MAG: Flp pilus assembly protein CpaB [Firmicutes bacterium]|nr:Flp pilus assembly protein CpaB [Bacillota bacterium]